MRCKHCDEEITQEDGLWYSNAFMFQRLCPNVLGLRYHEPAESFACHESEEETVVAWRVPNASPPGGYVIFQQRPDYWYDKNPDIVEELVVRRKDKKV